MHQTIHYYSVVTINNKQQNCGYILDKTLLHDYIAALARRAGDHEFKSRPAVSTLAAIEQ